MLVYIFGLFIVIIFDSIKPNLLNSEVTNMSIYLYRFISFEEFINLVINNKERYVRPASWDDGYEVPLLSYLNSRNNIQEVIRVMYYNLCPKNYYAIADNFYRFWHSKWFTYAQCWSDKKETDAMWRSYSYNNKAIRIRTSDEKLLHHAELLFSETDNYTLSLRKVEYDLDTRIILDQQINLLKKNNDLFEIYFHKRDVFNHEGEYRLLIADNTYYDAEEMSSKGVKFQIEDELKGKTDNEKIEYLTEKIIDQKIDWERSLIGNDIINIISDVQELIEGVLIHPLAPAWYVNIIQDVCEKNNLNFEGKSKIYELVLK